MNLNLSYVLHDTRSPVRVVVKPRRRSWLSSERIIALEYWRKCMKDGEAAAARLRNDFPTLFGARSMLCPLTRQHIQNFVYAERKAQDCQDDATPAETKKGRKRSLPDSVVNTIMATCDNIIETKGTTWSCGILRPVAIGIISRLGYGHTLKPVEGKSTSFECSVYFLRRLLKKFEFRQVKPHRNPRKVPADGEAQVRKFNLCVSYFVFRYKIPQELVQNWDQSGIMFLQQKGKTWAKKGDDGQQVHHGDKRQFTGTFGSNAAGEMLPAQLVFQGKTVVSLGKISGLASYVNSSVIAAAAAYGGWIFPASAPEEL